jgi:hypothetical protein
MTAIFFGGDGSPLSKPEDVIPLLGKQEKHWKERYSAYETAHSWFAAQMQGRLPPSIRAILDTSPIFAAAKLSKAFFEKQTELDNLGRGPSQTDVLAILEIKSGLAVLGVEGKVDESFGRIVSDWNDYSPSKLRRLAGLIERLRLKSSKSLGALRYQLIHRTVATLLEAEKAGAAEAVMLVQSFSPEEVKTGFSDFQDFAAAVGAPIAKPGELSQPVELPEVRLRLGWTINKMQSADTI